MRDYNVAEKTPMPQEEPRHIAIAREMAKEIINHDLPLQTEMLQELVQNVYVNRKDLIERCHKEIEQVKDHIERVTQANEVLKNIFG